MITHRADTARHATGRSVTDQSVNRAAAFCRSGSFSPAIWALVLVVLGGILPTVGLASAAAVPSDADGNGVEDVLDRWLAGRATWQDLRTESRHPRAAAAQADKAAEEEFSGPVQPAAGSWTEEQVRIIALGNSPARLQGARSAAQAAGQCQVIHDLEEFGGVQVLALDQTAMREFLKGDFDGLVVLDRDGLPALDQSRRQVGAEQMATGHWKLGEDWSVTLAILDSGCDTAHGDLGDYNQDDVDGPPPSVGDSTDWYSASGGWPLFQGYRVVGWHDVTNDFPQAVGPWDYHHHGTALASVTTGSGLENPAYRGINPGGRLTVVKFYDFDGVWHAWAGDYLAACAWTLENRETYRIRSVLTAVNWDADLGISDAMRAFVDAGIVPVAAMGNYGSDSAGPGYPAVLGDVLTVGSVEPQGAVSYFSGRGQVGQAKPDLLAPGGHVMTADNEPNDSYSVRQGTSLSAAHVAGSLYMLEEALVDNGVHLPLDRTGVKTRMALLRATADRVDTAESATGAYYTLPPHEYPDETRGWGLVRVDAAVRAALLPLFPGEDQEDTLSSDFQRPVTARRLALSPGIRYLIEAVPQNGLDVALEVVDPRLMDRDRFGSATIRVNSNGSGVSEFTYFHAPLESWTFLVVRQVSGSGRVILRVTEADDFSDPSTVVQLPGNLTGAPNVGHLAGESEPTIVIPSRVQVDYVARSVNVLDSSGVPLPGWPVYLFPHSSAQGGLSQPLVWELDGVDGDEIVLSSDFGSVYFFNRLGAWNRVELGFNVPLTTPVGVVDPAGQRKVVVLDTGGVFRAWSWGPTLAVNRPLGFTQPLDPAVGQLASGAAEELAIVFPSGVVLVTDSAGEPMPGWPVNLGVPLETPPILCDLDEDGLHEVIIPDLDTGTGNLRFHVLAGNGQPGPGHGSLVPAPAGGRWLKISEALVAGRYGVGDLRVSVSGLMNNGLTGAEAGLSFGLASLQATGQVQAQLLPGLNIHATTSQGVLTLQTALLPNPLAWDFLGGTGNEEGTLFSLEWTELLYGLTAIKGSAAGWFFPSVVNRPMEGRVPVNPGGERGTGLASCGSLLVDLDSGVFLRIQTLDNVVNIVPVLDGANLAPLWASARSDQRNSGAYPLRTFVAPVPAGGPSFSALSVYPNPGAGRFHFRLGSDPIGQPVAVGIYDLRGRHVRSVTLAAGEGTATWDGLDSRGRQVAAGTYLAIARRGGHQTTTRFVVTR
jgi:hypothetical protein